LTYQDDQDDASLDESELPDEADVGHDDDDVETEACPHCNRPVYEEAEVCPYCGNFISRARGPRRAPLWIVVGTVICLIVVLFFCFR
jgi:hypothetical protein